NRRHPAALDTAGHDTVEVAQVGADVERKAVERHPAAEADADRGNLGVADPDAGQTRAAPGANPAVRQRVDHDLFKIAQVAQNVARGALQPKNRIADELSRAVIGHLAAA